MKRFLLLIAALAVVVAACGGGDGEASDVPTLTSGELLVCTDAPYEPFENTDEDGNVSDGVDVDIVEAIGEELGLSVEWTIQPFDGIWLAPSAGTCDLVASAMTITEERAAQALFSDPYYLADQSLLVKADSGVATLDDLDGMNVAVQTGTTGEIYAQDNAPDGVTIVSYDEPAAMFLALEGDDVAAILQDLPVNQARANLDDSFELAETYVTGEEYGFATAQENTELMDAINEALATVIDDGTVDAIFETYFG